MVRPLPSVEDNNSPKLQVESGEGSYSDDDSFEGPGSGKMQTSTPPSDSKGSQGERRGEKEEKEEEEEAYMPAGSSYHLGEEDFEEKGEAAPTREQGGEDEAIYGEEVFEQDATTKCFHSKR